MWGRRSLFRHDDAASADVASQRSSSLPPVADRDAAAAAPSRARHHNPIGVSRRSSVAQQAVHQGPADGGRGDPFRQRSHSLTRCSLTRSTAAEGSAPGGRLTRADSLASLGSQGSEIEEPGWFSHAFHDVRDSGKPGAPWPAERPGAAPADAGAGEGDDDGDGDGDGDGAGGRAAAGGASPGPGPSPRTSPISTREQDGSDPSRDGGGRHEVGAR